MPSSSYAGGCVATGTGLGDMEDDTSDFCSDLGIFTVVPTPKED